jgi:SAM-dependent methyltransferase
MRAKVRVGSVIRSSRTNAVISYVNMLPPPVDVPKLSSSLAERFVPLPHLFDAAPFVAKHPPVPSRSTLSRFVSVMWLGSCKMRLLDGDAALALLGDLRRTLLLDVGAGPGDVLDPLRPLFSETACATEASLPCALRLRNRGVDAAWCDSLDALPSWLESRIASNGGADVIALQNVLDRADRPRSLLAAAKRRLSPSGALLVALRVPLDQYVLTPGNMVVRPTEDLMSDCFRLGDSFEDAVCRVNDRLFEPAGLRIERFSQAPYFCQGDSADADFYALNDLVAVLRDSELLVADRLAPNSEPVPVDLSSP